MNFPTYRFDSSRFRQLGFVSWALLLIMAIVFYKERAIFLDGAFQLEILINQKQFQIYHYRLTNPLTQLLALISVYLHLPLKVVLMAYSVNFILMFGSIYYAIVGWCKNDFLGWVLLFFFTLMVLDSFYFLPPELYQGAAFLLLWWAIILKYPRLDKPWQIISLALLMILILSDSRLLATCFFYCFIFFWLSNKHLRHVKYYALLGLMFLLMYIHGKYFVSAYDAGKLKVFKENLHQFFPNYLDIPANKIFLKKCLLYYHGYVAALLTVITGYIIAVVKKQKQIAYPLLKLVLVLGANLAFLLLLHLGSPNTSYRFYAEVNYLPLSIFVCVPLLFDIFPLIKKENLVLLLFGITILYRLSLIAANHKTFSNRLEWYTQRMEAAVDKGSSKSILPWQKSPKDLIIQPWASAQETLLLSSLRGPDHSRTLLVADQPSQFDRALKEGRFFLTGFYYPAPTQKMNEIYFNLTGKGDYLIWEE